MNCTQHKVFGWIVHRCDAEAGETFDLVNKREAPTNRLSARTIYTAGRITGRHADNPSIPALDRFPGFATDNLPNPLPKLHLNMTVQESAVWWCVSAPANPSLPDVSFIRLQPGESESRPAGSLIFICDGAASVNGNTFNGPKAVRAQNNVVLTAIDKPVYAMVFDRENANA